MRLLWLDATHSCSCRHCLALPSSRASSARMRARAHTHTHTFVHFKATQCPSHHYHSNGLATALTFTLGRCMCGSSPSSGMERVKYRAACVKAGNSRHASRQPVCRCDASTPPMNTCQLRRCDMHARRLSGGHVAVGQRCMLLLLLLLASVMCNMDKPHHQKHRTCYTHR